MSTDPHDAWNIARQQGDIGIDGLRVFRLAPVGKIQQRWLRASDLDWIEVLSDLAPTQLPGSSAPSHSLRVHLRGGGHLDLLTSVTLSNRQEATRIAAGLVRLLRGEAEFPIELHPWRPRNLQLFENRERFEARWGYGLRVRLEADSESLRVRRTGHPRIDIDSDDVVSLTIEPGPAGARRERYRLVAALRRRLRLDLLSRFPDPVFLGYLAQQASRRLGLAGSQRLSRALMG